MRESARRLRYPNSMDDPYFLLPKETHGTFEAPEERKRHFREGMMPIVEHVRDALYKKFYCPPGIPMGPFLDRESRCVVNHGMTPEMLREAGGLSCNEALSILRGQPVSFEDEDEGLSAREMLEWLDAWGWTPEEESDG